ncbi:uncharacterized protein [Elaeis guineensis]|uniref:uncharacterized protein isoform X2 n=1 Tax=Elaeis guineensis var. tenera TaxID=51953 RepID=UPI003C6D2D0F
MWSRRAFLFFQRIRSAAQFAAADARRVSTTGPSISFSGSKSYGQFNYGSAWRKHPWDFMLGIMLSGPVAIYLSFSRNPVSAQDVSEADLVTENDEAQAYVTGLRRIEDGSVISNSHTSRWRIFTDHGRDLFLKGKLDEAEKYFQSAVHEAKEGFGTRDPHVASSYNNLAELYRVSKAFEKAEPLYLEAISILEESFGADDIRVGAALHNLGQFYLAQRKLEQARTCYEIKGRVLGHGHTDYANTMYHLGTVLHLLGKEKDSMALIQESISILEENGLGESTTCVRRMRYLSQILLSSNRLAEAESLQRKILHILELSKGWDSLETVLAAERLALTLQANGSLLEAQELLERCLVARKEILPPAHVQVAANMLHLARIAMLNSKQLWKMKSSKAKSELEKAKLLIDNSIRMAKAVLDHPTKNRNSLQSNNAHTDIEKDQHVALIILLQSLDAVGLLEVTKHEILETKFPEDIQEACEFPSEAELALRECVSIFKEPHTRRMLLNASDVTAEYLSCLKHLTSLLGESTDESKLRVLQELKYELQHIEAELTPRRQRN